jgi:hypothetical protein
MDSLAPPPVEQDRPQPTRQGSTGPGNFVSKGKEVLQRLIEMATMDPEVSTKLSTITAQVTELIEEKVQAAGGPEALADRGMDGPMSPAPPAPKAPGLRSPALAKPSGLPPRR